MKGFRSTNIQYFTKIMRLFMIVYSTRKMMDHNGEEKTPCLFLDNGLRT